MSNPAGFDPSGNFLGANRSDLPTNSSMVLMPSLAMISRISRAMNIMKLMTYSGLPLNLLRSSGFCVATPTGHVSRWHTRIMTQPIVTSGAVAKPNSSAPSIAAMTTSLPVKSLPSASMTTCDLRLFCIRVWWVSATPNSQGRPALCIDDAGAAPVPPS